MGGRRKTQLFLDQGSAQKGRVRVIRSANSGEFPKSDDLLDYQGSDQQSIKLYSKKILTMPKLFMCITEKVFVAAHDIGMERFESYEQNLST